MKKFLITIAFEILWVCIAFSQNTHYSIGVSYIQQYPDGPNISNSALPNAEANISYSFINATHFKMNSGMGITTHNFSLKDISENKTYSYLRVEPFASLSVSGCLSEECAFPVHGIYAGVRAGFFNQWNFNPSWHVGLLSKPFGKVQFYAQFSKLLYYSIPDNNYLLFDFTDNFYPLGNERWSITAGVQFDFGRKKE